jgi:hypothetical protein
VDEILARVLAEHVGGYLQLVERMVAARARRLEVETLRMVAAWRALLRLHQPDSHSCRGCRRQRSAMCGVWQVATSYFLRRDSAEGRSLAGLDDG